MTHPSSSDRIKDALAVLTANSDNALAVIDEEIADLEGEIEQLRRVRKVLVKASGKKQRRSPAGSSAAEPKRVGHWDEIEEQVFNYVSENGKATSGDIAEELGLVAMQVGKAVAASQRLTKQGAYVCLIEE